MSKLVRSIVFRRVMDVLRKNPYGLSSTQLAKILNINRMTLVKYLSIMRVKGLVEFKEIGMAKVWHTSTKYDLMSLIASEESSSIQAIVHGKRVKIRDKMGDEISLPLFRAMKAALALSTSPERAMYEAGQFIATKCLPSEYTKEASKIATKLSEIFINLNLGIIKPIQVQPTLWTFKLEESASAFGTAVRGNKLCYFEAGLISGFVGGSLGMRVLVRETKCTAEGSAFCEFSVKFR